MKKLLILLSVLFFTSTLFAQYKIQIQQKNAFLKHKLAILCDSQDPQLNSALCQLFSKYWKHGSAELVENQKELNELESKGDYIFVRHTARLLSDEKGEFRTDFLDFYDSEWQGENLATCYMGKTSLTSNHLYIKFFIRALEYALENNEATDSLNLKRNAQDLAQLRNKTVYIPRRMLGDSNEKILSAKIESNATKAEQKNVSLGSYTFTFKIVDDEALNQLANDETHSIYVANLVTLPDHTTGFYIYDVNAGKILYKSCQNEALINLTALNGLNMAIMKTRLQSSL